MLPFSFRDQLFLCYNNARVDFVESLKTLAA